jgi:hypothetical protein
MDINHRIKGLFSQASSGAENRDKGSVGRREKLWKRDRLVATCMDEKWWPRRQERGKQTANLP